MGYAYVTLLTSVDYLPAAIILDRNLKELKSQFDLYVMVTDNIYDQVVDYLSKEHVHYIKVSPIQYSTEALESMNNDPRLSTIASKLNVFELTDFEKVIYIDVDAAFLKTPDLIFNYPDGSLYNLGSKQGFCGLFVCCPWTHPIHFYKTLIKYTSAWESNVIEELWFPFKTNEDYRIPYKYFIPITIENFETLEPLNSNVWGIHFMGSHKPWKFNSPEEYGIALESEGYQFGPIRKSVAEWYYTHYVEPLKKQYPEIFKY